MYLYEAPRSKPEIEIEIESPFQAGEYSVYSTLYLELFTPYKLAGWAGLSAYLRAYWLVFVPGSWLVPEMRQGRWAEGDGGGGLEFEVGVCARLYEYGVWSTEHGVQRTDIGTYDGYG